MTRIVLSTALGAFVIEADSVAAPRTVAYVEDLVAAGHLASGAFYRSTRLGSEGRAALIQGGPLAPLFTGDGRAVPSIQLLDVIETTSMTGLAHRRATVSLGRDLLGTGHVLPELFICLDDYPELDAGGRNEPDDCGFPAFGRVVEGLGVVETIAAGDTSGHSPIARLAGEVLVRPVPILAAHAGPPDSQETPN